MTQEEKELLLKDLGGRLPYGVKILDIPANVIGKLFLISTTDTVQYETTDDAGVQTLYNIKPYLFPLSSMTEKQKNEYQYIAERWMNDLGYSISDIIDWLNENHFDYRGLIEKGLAIDATGKKIY